jgi:hypothetical protein
MNKIRTIILSFAVVIGLAALPLVPATAFAEVNAIDSIGQGVQGAGGKTASTTELTDLIKSIINVMLFILGAIAVIMIIIGGIRYTTSNGDASATKGAKDTILYAVIGLIVAILAYAIVNFVVAAFKSNG